MKNANSESLLVPCRFERHSEREGGRYDETGLYSNLPVAYIAASGENKVA